MSSEEDRFFMPQSASDRLLAESPPVDRDLEYLCQVQAVVLHTLMKKNLLTYDEVKDCLSRASGLLRIRGIDASDTYAIAQKALAAVMINGTEKKDIRSEVGL